MAPFECNVGTCHYTTGDKSALLQHMRAHTGQKPFECKICNFGFTTKANCERHLKNKHQKLTRESIRESLIIHETEDTETMISRMGPRSSPSRWISSMMISRTSCVYVRSPLFRVIMSPFSGVAAMTCGDGRHAAARRNSDDV